jgi:hypothetical protein
MTCGFILIIPFQDDEDLNDLPKVVACGELVPASLVSIFISYATGCLWPCNFKHR